MEPTRSKSNPLNTTPATKSSPGTSPRKSEPTATNKPSVIAMDQSNLGPLLEKVKIQNMLPAQFHQQNGRDENDLNPSLYFLSQFLALISIALITNWLIQYFGGFNDNRISRIINLHPLIMVFAFVYIFANSLLFLNSAESLQAPRLVICILTGIYGFIGLLIAFFWHRTGPKPHFRSMHSWFGLVTWILFYGYLYFAYQVYFHKGYQERQRIRLLYYLRLFGLAVLIMAGTTCFLGIDQLILWNRMEIINFIWYNTTDSVTTIIDKGHQSTPYRQQKSFLGNIIGIFLFCYISSMIHIIINLRYRPRSSAKREEMERQLRHSIKQVLNKLEMAGTFQEDSYSSTSYPPRTSLVNTPTTSITTSRKS